MLTALIAGVWLVNGLLCKLLGLVPRHEEIVARILGSEHAGLLTRAIGLGEIVIAGWVASRWEPRWCAAAQVALVVTMNTLEWFLVPDLLLFGRANALVALAFVVVVGWWGVRRKEKN